VERYLVLLAVSGMLVACASSPATVAEVPAASNPALAAPVSPFPSATEVSAMAGAVRPAAAEAVPLSEVASWEMEGPLAAQVAVEPITAVEGAWEARLASALPSSTKLVHTAGMRCVARQYARFLLEETGDPPESLEEFWLSRCGSPAQHLSASWSTWAQVSPDREEEVLAESVADRIKERVASLDHAKPTSVGIGFRRAGERAVMVVVSATRVLEVQPFVPLLGEDGVITIEGEVLIGVDHVFGLASHGEFGVERCQRDEAVKVPYFRLRCPANPADRVATLQIAGTMPGRVLGKTLLDVVVFPAGARVDRWDRWPLALPEDLVAMPERRAQIFAGIQFIRQQAGLSPMILEERQSEVSDKLAPTYFSGLSAGGQGETDRIILGLAAGWDVQALIRDVRHVHIQGPVASAPQALLAELVMSPAGRQAVLSAEHDHLALGVSESEASAGRLGLVLTSYSTFPVEAGPDDVAAVFDRLNVQRIAAGRAAAGRLPTVDAIAQRTVKDLARASSGQDRLQTTINEAMTALKGRRGHVNVLTLTSVNLRDLPFNKLLLDAPALDVAIGVSQGHPEGHPWGVYFVVIVAFESTDVREAALPTPGAGGADEAAVTAAPSLASQNCSASVEPASAVVEECPEATTWATASK